MNLLRKPQPGKFQPRWLTFPCPDECGREEVWHDGELVASHAVAKTTGQIPEWNDRDRQRYERHQKQELALWREKRRRLISTIVTFAWLIYACTPWFWGSLHPAEHIALGLAGVVALAMWWGYSCGYCTGKFEGERLAELKQNPMYYPALVAQKFGKGRRHA